MNFNGTKYIGVEVIIELKNDTQLIGTLEDTDTHMNSTLNNVQQVSNYS